MLGELSLQRSLDQASRAGFGTVVGMAVGAAGKLAIGIAMVVSFCWPDFSEPRLFSLLLVSSNLIQDEIPEAFYLICYCRD